MADAATINQHVDTFKQLVGDRRELNQLWEELAEVLSPERRGFASNINPGSRTEKIYDTDPIVAKRGLTNAIGGMLRPKSSPNGRWFDMVPDNEELLEDAEARAWIEDSERRMWSAIYNPKAHFINTTGEVDDDTVAFGTGALFTGVRKDMSGLLYRAFHMRDVYFTLDSDGEIDTIYIRIRYTTRQASQMWDKENLSREINEHMEKNPSDQVTRFEFVWVVGPRKIRDPRRIDNKNMPFFSLVIECDTKHEVVESGFEEFPFAVPRWDTKSGEPYGRGPGVLALPDALTLNQMGKTMLRALHRAVDPPWLLPSDSMVNSPRNRPGGVTYYDAAAIKAIGLRNPFMQMESRAQIPWAMEAQTQKREAIFAVFFRNVLNLPVQGPQMTATEVIQRREEFIREIGAVFGRLEADYSAPLIERTFGLMARNGGFSPPPEILEEEIINFRFASPIEKVQRQINEAMVAEGIGKIMQVGAVRPEVMDVVNWTGWARGVTRSSEFPIDMVNSEDEIEANREARQAQEEALRNQEALKKLSETAESATSAMQNIQGGEQAA